MDVMTGKNIIITGGYSGIGYEASKKLAEWGAFVIISGPNGKKGLEACENITKHIKFNKYQGSVTFLPLDLTLQTSIENFSKQVLEITKGNIYSLILNSGVMVSKFELLNGVERDFGRE